MDTADLIMALPTLSDQLDALLGFQVTALAISQLNRNLSFSPQSILRKLHFHLENILILNDYKNLLFFSRRILPK